MKKIIFIIFTIALTSFAKTGGDDFIPWSFKADELYKEIDILVSEKKCSVKCNADAVTHTEFILNCKITCGNQKRKYKDIKLENKIKTEYCSCESSNWACNPNGFIPPGCDCVCRYLDL